MTLPQRVAHIVNHGMAALHPCVYGDLTARGAVSDIAADLQKEIALLCPGRDAKAIVDEFVAALPEVRRLVETDVDAAYDGDPAATSRMEVVMAYPGLYAVTVHRLAHVLYKLKVPILPRVMSELAHSKTGIDRHRRRHRGDDGHRTQRAALPGRDARGTLLREGRQWSAREGPQAPSEHRGQRGHLRERDDPRRGYDDRARLRDRRQRLAHRVRPAQLPRLQQAPRTRYKDERLKIPRLPF